MRHKNKLILLICILVLLIMYDDGSHLLAKGTIYAIGCNENYPYEYINESGIPSGFSVDLIKEISEELNMNCRVELVPYDRFLFLKKNPDVDIVLGVIRGDSGDEYPFFRTNVKINFSIFTDSNSQIFTINDMRNLKILIAANSVIADPIKYEIRKFFKPKLISSSNEINSFTLLKIKECDVVFMSGPTARKIIENKNLIGIKEVPVNIGFFDYGFGIRKNRDELKSALTAGYNRIFEKGKYQEIYNRWFEGTNNNFFGETGIYVSAGIFSFLIFILFIIINSFVLRRRIKEKTEELHISMSELNKTQVLLRESEKRFKRIFNKSPSGLMILNSSGRVLLFNEAIVEIFGVDKPHEITDLDVINSPISSEWFKTRLRNYHDINIEVKFNFELIKETGYYSTSKTGVIILELIIIPIQINSESPVSGYICQFSDKTNEKKLLEEIKYSKRKLELVFESVKDGLWEWNLATQKVRYNKKFFSFLGYKMESYPDDINTLLEFIHESERESVKNELYKKVFNGKSFNLEYRMVMKNGRIINMRSRGEPIEWDSDLKPLRVIGVQTEITLQRDIYSRINLFKNELKDREVLLHDKDCNLTLRDKIFLLVDDNYLIYLHISEFLKKHKTLLLYAASGSEAIEVLKGRQDVSLIILDHYMPGMDGVSLLKEIRKIKYDIPVVIQTGELNESITGYFFNEGFNGVLGKPIEENLFIKTISDIMESSFYNENQNLS